MKEAACPKLRRWFTKQGLANFKNSLSEIDWSVFYNIDYCVEYLSEFLVSSYQTLIHNHFPLKKCLDKRKSPVNWFNFSLRKKRDLLSSIKTICNVTRNPTFISTYHALRKDYLHEIKVAKATAYNNYLITSQNKARDTWKLVNSERNAGANNNLSSDISNDSFNKYFSSIADKITCTLPLDSNKNCNTDPPVSSPVSCSFFLLPATECEVRTAIKLLKNSNCPDYYDINTLLVKESIDIISGPLTALFNRCFLQGNFPNAFKRSKVIPVFKKGTVSDVENYRPISIVPIFGKILEAIINTRLTSYIQRNSILNHSQFGFRTGRTTVQAIHEVVNRVVMELEGGNMVSITLCDLSKAFDCVNHQILTEKLSFYGIRGLPLLLLKSYLSNRLQCVSRNDSPSGLLPVNHGVPQGSILGPLLFLIYVNDFAQAIYPGSCVLYADDTTLINSDTSIDNLRKISSDVEEVAKSWFTRNYLKLNQNKTQQLIFPGKTNQTLNSSVTLLGITLDNKLNWHRHIDSLNRKLASTIYLFRKLKNTLHLETLRTIYFALFHSHICHGIALWGNSSSSTKIFRQQKKIIRIMVNAKTRDSCKRWFIHLNIMPLPSLYIYHTLLEIHSNKTTFKIQSDLHSHNTRHASDIRIPRFRLTRSKNNYLNINLYNRLPQRTKQLEIRNFKSEIKNIMLRNCFYSIAEFVDFTKKLI